MLPIKTTPKKPDQVEIPDVELHDDVYFRHATGPKVGRVVARGQHGMTVASGGEHHKVKWEHFLGHKNRVRPDVRVIDQGVDGMLVEDPHGRRRYVHDPIGDEPAPAAKPMAKSIGPTILFFGVAEDMAKAMGGIKNRPGLTLKDITDKNGHQSKRYVRTDKPAKKVRGGGKGGGGDGGGKKPPGPPDESAHTPAQRHSTGDKVSFSVGSLKGGGHIVGTPGRDGASVEDDSGHVHQVLYSQIDSKPADAGADAPSETPTAPAADSHDGHPAAHPEQKKFSPSRIQSKHDDPDEIARTLFDTSEMEKLPKKAAQPVDSWDELLSKGRVGLEEYKGILDKVAEELDLVTGKRPASLDFTQEEENHKAEEEGRKPKDLKAKDYMLPEHWDDPHGYLFLGPLKGYKRALEKVTTEYSDKDGHQDWTQIRDMVRATIAVPSMTQVPMVIKTLRDAGLVPVQKPKNNFVTPLPGGYRDVNIIVRLPNGLLAEMQIHVKPMTLAKEKGHKHYETSRTIEAKYKKGGIDVDKENWEAGDRAAHSEAMAKQERIYGDAWDAAKKPANPLEK